MGGCSSAADQDAQIPKPLSSSIENKFKTIEQRVLNVPLDLSGVEEVHTSNGKITDFIAKNGTKIRFTYQQLDLQASLDSDKKFQDKEFQRSQERLGPETYPQKIEWKRPSEFMKEEFSIFEGKIQPLDIKQGRLGDCYFLSAIISISEYPFIVKRLFETTDVSSYCYYGVWLFIDGIWQCIVVDDYFPLHNNKPIFSRNNGGELWVMLLEKAYSKVFGSYQAIESGLTGIALNALTGAPFEYLNKDSKTSIDIEGAWNFLTQHFSMQHLVTGSTENNDRNGYLGLVSSHAYTVLDIQEVYIATKKQKKKKERILKLLNPWGKYEWKGRWSDYSDVWSEELRQQLQYEKADDGIFWINIEDFVQNFGQICACKYNKNYITTSLKLEFPKEEENFRGVFLKTTNRTEGYISLIQQDHRKFGKNFQYSMVRLIVLKIDKFTNQLGTYINDFIDCDHDGTVRVELDPGEYYLVIEVDWKCSFSRSLVVNYYGQHPVNLVEDATKLEMSSLFNEIVLLHEKYTEKERIYEYAKDNKIRRTTGSVAGYIYYHYSNKSVDNNYLCQSVSLKERKYVDVIGQTQNDQFTVKVYPGEERIVRLKVHKDGNSYYSFSTKIQFYIVEKYSLEKLKELADKKPTKVKKREIDGKEIDVRVKTYNYNGGIVLLYQNKMDKYAYIEEIIFEMDNLDLENETLTASNKLEIELEPNSQKMLSFVVTSPGKEIVFRTKMSFYLNAPEFKF